MCPDRKLQWFKSRKFGPENRDCTTADIKRLRAIVVNVWKDKYAAIATDTDAVEVAKVAKAKKGKKIVVMYLLLS